MDELTPHELLVQRDGRVWLREVFGERIGRIARDGSWFVPICECSWEGLNQRRRIGALWALTDHFNAARNEQSASALGVDDV